MSFPPYTGQQEIIANWAIGLYPKLLDTYGVAVNPDATVVALAVVGPCDTETDPCGGLYLYSTDGQFLASLDRKGGQPYYDVAWDKVGNLYALDGGSNGVWRIYSPPGSNQTTTVAVPIIQAYNALLPPLLLNPMVNMAAVGFTLQGQSNVTYIIQRSGDLVNWGPVATNQSALTNVYLNVAGNGGQSFYRAVTSP